MGATINKLPIGIQSFEIMRSDAYYYATRHRSSKSSWIRAGIFLSRPSRFGKSLFIDTLKQAFAGKNEYFGGLYLEDRWDWDVCYPIISLSFGTGVVNNTANLETIIVSLIDEVANHYGIWIKGELSSLRFRELIIKLHDQHRKKVVILIDEYDKPHPGPCVYQGDRPDPHLFLSRKGQCPGHCPEVTKTLCRCVKAS